MSHAARIAYREANPIRSEDDIAVCQVFGPENLHYNIFDIAELLSIHPFDIEEWGFYVYDEWTPVRNFAAIVARAKKEYNRD